MSDAISGFWLGHLRLSEAKAKTEWVVFPSPFLAHFDLLGDTRWMCYPWRITKTGLKKILDRLLTWPSERQGDVAHVAELREVSKRFRASRA